MGKFLDSIGLAYIIAKIKTALGLKQDTLTVGDGIDITSNVISNTQGIEYIVGTQTAATNAWTGVSADSSLSVGKIIAYKLPYAGTSSAATLNLTLANGTKTGAKALRRTGSSTVTTHFAVNNVIVLIYDGTYWRVSAYYDSDSNTIPTGYCTTGAGTAAKVASNTYGYRDDANYFPCLFRYANTASNATLAIGTYAETALPIYVNGARTSSSNTFGAGVTLFLYYNGAYYCYNDGRLPIVVDGVVTSVQDALSALDIPTKTSDLTNDSGFITDAGVTSFNGSTGAVTYTAPVTSVNGSTGAITGLATTTQVDAKQDALVSGTNIKTVNGVSLLGSGNIAAGEPLADELSLAAEDYGEWGYLYYDLEQETIEFTDGVPVSRGGTGASTASGARSNLGAQATLVSGTNIKTINNQSLLGSGNITISGGGGDYLPTKSPTIEEDPDNYNLASLNFRDGTVSISMYDAEASGGFGSGKSLDIGVTQDSGASSPASVSLGATSSDWSTSSNLRLDSDGEISATGNVDITGNLDIQGGGTSSHSDTIDTDQSNCNVSSNTYYPATGWMDRDGRYFAFVQAAAFTNGTTRLSLAARNLVNNSTRTDSYLTLDMLKDGTKKATFNGTMSSAELGFSSTGVEVHLSNQTKTHRIALTAVPNLRIDESSDGGSTWSTAAYVFHSGTERTANTVLAAPNGSNGGASFRKLVADDVTGLGDTAYGAGQSGIANAKAAVSCASGTTVNLDTITLAAGTWLVTYSVEWASNASGRRAMTLTTNATSISSTPVYMVSGAPANGLATNFSRTQVIVATSSTTRYLNAYQNSGSALNCRSCIQAVRIA